MKREEIIKRLKMPFNDNPRMYFEALDEAIKALEQEPCDDAISRADAIDALGYNISITSDEGLDEYRTVLKEMLGKIYDVQKTQIEALPSIQQKPKTGHWIWQTEDIYRCSECGNDIRVKEVMYVPQYVCCPMCGTKMQAESEE